MKARQIPTGKHFAFFRQFSAFDAIQPIRLQDDIWVMPESAIDYIENQYLNATEHTKQNHPGIVQGVLDMVDFTVNETRKLSSVDIDEKTQLHPQYKQEPTKEQVLQMTLETLFPDLDESKTIAELKTELKAKDIEKGKITR